MHNDQADPNVKASSSEKPIFNVPTRYQYFHGREDILVEIGRTLSSSSAGLPQQQCSCLIHAMGGMGKTQIALEFAHRNRDYYQYVFWLGAHQAPELAISFASIAMKLKAPDADTMGLGRRIEFVKDWLESKSNIHRKVEKMTLIRVFLDRNWLLIFDNADSWDCIRPYWPNGTNGAIIVTSQIAGLVQAGPIRSHVQPRPLNEEEGANLLLDLAQHKNPSEEDMAAARGVSGVVGGLPIAIAHIAGYMFNSAVTLPELIPRLKTQEAYTIWSSEKTWSTAMYEQRLDMVWHVALQELPEEAMNLLQILAMMSPDFIPEAMLFGQVDKDLDLFVKTKSR